MTAVADPAILKGVERGGDNVSALSSFIANAHNELYAFYTGKGDLLKYSEAPLNPPLHHCTSVQGTADPEQKFRAGRKLTGKDQVKKY